MTQPQPVEPPLPDERWPAWSVDEAVAAAGAAALTAAMLAAVPAGVLAAAFVAWALEQGLSTTITGGGMTSFVMPEPGDAVRGGADRAPRTTLDLVTEWLHGQVPLDYLIDELTPAIDDIHAEGELAGRRSAEALVDALTDGYDVRAVPGDDDGVTLEVDWSDWTPGHPEAARAILSEDGSRVSMLELLAEDGVTISSVAANRLDEIAAVLADGIEQGKSSDAIALALRGVLDDPEWAYMTAVTEVNRAVSAATLAEYRESGIPAKGWLTALDQRVCKRCAADEEAGAIDLDEEFPSGQQRPPGHPRCRCALIPELELTIAKAAGRGATMRRYWTRGPGLAKWSGDPHPWTALYRHLRKHIKSDRLAKRTASRWFHEALGVWPGERQGDNPVGPG